MLYLNMKYSYKIQFFLTLLLLGIALFVATSPVFAAKRISRVKLKALIVIAQERIQKEVETTNQIEVKNEAKTETRIVTFNKEITEIEKSEIETTYKVNFETKGKNRHRYVVNPSNEDKLEALLTDSRVEAVVNNDTYKVSEQTIDWGVEKMNVPTAWNNPSPNTGTGIVIAVIDTGVQLDHPDLVGSIQPGGYDYVNDDADPSDDYGHGTYMAGAIVAQNNTIGSLGVAYNAKILPYKVCNVNGECSAIDIADAVEDAVLANVDIINLSLGGSPNALIQQAIQDATDAGIIVVAAAGNENQEGCLYPAAYTNVVCVGSTTDTDVKASFSNFGSELDIVTPGLYILSTSPGSTYASVSGTSISTAYYSGVAALVESMLKELCIAEPLNVACADMRTYTQLLINEVTVRDIGTPGKDSDFGNGIVDLSQIFTETNTVHTAPTNPIRKGVAYGQFIDLTNNNNYQIAVTSCTIMSKNQMRAQTVPAFSLSQLYQGATLFESPVNDIYYSTFTLSTPVIIDAAATKTFSYSYIPSAELLTNDNVVYSFVCTYDRSSTLAVEEYRTEEGILTTTVSLPIVLTNVYFTFGKLRYNQTVFSSQLRAIDTVYLKNYNPSQVRLTQFFLYDYVKKGNQGFTKTWRNSTSFTLRTNYLLPAPRKYAYVAEFQDISTGTKIKKYFVFFTK